VKEGKVYGFPQDFYSWDQPDTRWILGLTWLAKKLQPALFTDISVARTTEDFFNFMYGFNEASFRASIVPKIQGDVGEQF
jgi:iron complex transport system substrate-binding protein